MLSGKDAAKMQPGGKSAAQKRVVFSAGSLRSVGTHSHNTDSDVVSVTEFQDQMRLGNPPSSHMSVQRVPPTLSLRSLNLTLGVCGSQKIGVSRVVLIGNFQ